MHVSVKKTSPTADSQKRIFIRLELKSKVKFKRMFHSPNNGQSNSQKTHPGIMLNISRGGMLLLTSAELEPDDFLAISFEIPRLASLTNVLGKVKRVEKDKKKYVVGIEFCELADFYPYMSIRNSAALPHGLESFRHKFEDLLLRRKLAALV
jgi:hypothetical protein